MSRYDGLIIPRSYGEYINKTDAATLLQALQLSGVMDNVPTAGSNHPVKSSGVYSAILSRLEQKTFIATAGGTDTGLSINAGSLGKTYILICSAQWDAGNNTSSAIYLIRCGFNGGYFQKVTISEVNINSNFPLTITKSENDKLVLTSPSNVWRVKIISN